MSEPKLTKQQIYDKIRESSKDEYILEEMIRLGFWPEATDKPTVTEKIIKRRAELSSELRQLGREKSLYDDPERALKELHKQRKKEALERREENRQQKNLQRYERSLAWHEKQQHEITYLGEGISYGLNSHEFNEERLGKQSLPTLKNAESLAVAMGISINELRFLAYKKNLSKRSHYQHFAIPKKTGGVRNIAAPMPRLKRAQYWILDNILKPLKIHDCAHGFVNARSILTNALPHVKKDLVINMDLQDFFPSVGFSRVKGLFKGFGYSEAVATILASLCSEADMALVDMDGEAYFLAQSDPKLPQGAPTSPAISNLICRKLDARILGAAESLGYSYTRYADDLTFSGDKKDDASVQKLLWRVRSIIKSEGFVVHPKKTRIMRKHKRQEVTGVVVNQKPSVDRKKLKLFRALLHQIDKTGPEDKVWGEGELFSCIKGYAHFVAMIDPAKGRKLVEKTQQLQKRYAQNISYRVPSELNNKNFRSLAAKGQAPRENWWQAQSPAKPILEKTALEIKEINKAEKADARAAKKATSTDQASNNRNNSQTSRQASNQNESNSNGQKRETKNTSQSVFKNITSWLIAAFIIIQILKIFLR